MSDLKEDFLKPGKDYRSAPFWSWNDRLSAEELVRQVKDMREHGMGGFFMHSREGLEIEYLGREWMDCVREVVSSSKDVGMNVWLYDEDRWPSGSAGGKVPSRGDEYRAKGLGMQKITGERELTGDEVSCFCVKLENGKITDLRKIEGEKAISPKEGEVGLVFTREVAGPDEWFNNEAYADNLNPEAVRAFIDSTYEAYREEVGNEFGGTIPGIFTDEPNFSAGTFREGIDRIPWTDGLDEYFQKICGYSFLDVVPYFFFDGEKTGRVRHDYWFTLTRRFQEAYSKQLGTWCGKNNLALTGHYLLENNFPGQIKTAGAIMPHYVYQQVPGIDLLTEQIGETLTVKQCSSVANQFGRKVVLSEMYGCSGWEFTFEGQKWIGDWQYALGVTLRCQHLTLYTLKGCRKRDFPPSFNYNTTWWKYNKVVEDYFARLSSVLMKGKARRDILLLHPITGAWCIYNGRNEEKAQRMSERFRKILEGILSCHYDVDLGDELIIKDYGQIKEGKFFVNKAAYSVVVLPPMENIELSTLQLLEDFLDQKGKVFVMGSLPERVDGKESEEYTRLTGYEEFTQVKDTKELADLLEENLEREISIRERGEEAPSFIYIEREIRGKKIFFIVNLDRKNSHRVNLSLEGEGRLEEWDPLTGKIYGIPIKKEDNFLSVEAFFPPAGSKLYIIDPEGEPETEPPLDKGKVFVKRWREPSGDAFIGPHTEFERTDPNIRVLDRASYRFGGEDWSEDMPIWKAQKEVRERLGMRSVHVNRIPQRYLWTTKPHPNDGKSVSFRITFHVEDVPENPCYLLLEGARDFIIYFNGQRVPSEPAGWYLDRNFNRIPLPTLRQGQNELILSCEYKNRMEVEDCFIIGDFAVDIERRSIKREPEKLHFGDWISQGYPHYAGGMVYKEEVNIEEEKDARFFVKLGDYSAVTVAVWVNGKLVGHIPWQQADGLEVTDYLESGKNLIGIEVTGSPRNMLGPLHRKGGYEPWTSSRSFRTEGNAWTDEYVLWSWGLFEQVRICKVRR